MFLNIIFRLMWQRRHINYQNIHVTEVLTNLKFNKWFCSICKTQVLREQVHSFRDERKRINHSWRSNLVPEVVIHKLWLKYDLLRLFITIKGDYNWKSSPILCSIKEFGYFCIRVVWQSIMQKISAVPKSPNRYQQLSIIAFAICVSIRYGIIDYPLQRYKIFRPKANYVKIPVYAGISPVDLKNTNLHQPQIK